MCIRDRAGAKGYLLKDTPPDELVFAIEKVSRGETVLGGQIASRVVSRLNEASAPGAKDHGGLSEREKEVTKLVGSGATNAEIARALYISEGTARNHVSKILRKLDLRDRTQLAIWAAEHGLKDRR
jgi:DNA-binding NarL/FixJ family response regulator